MMVWRSQVFAYHELVGGTPQEFETMLDTLDAVDRKKKKELLAKFNDTLGGRAQA